MEYAIKILKENKALLENNKAKNSQEILELKKAIDSLTIIENSKIDYLSLSNNFASHTCTLWTAYDEGKEFFIPQIDKIHNDLLKDMEKKYNELEDNIKKQSDSEILVKFLDDQSNEEYELENMMRSLKSVYDEIKKLTNEYYGTDLYKGYWYLYSEIYFDFKCKYFQAGINRRQSADLDIFTLAKDLIHHYFVFTSPIIPSAIILIRQSIEVKILQTFGIKEFKNEKGEIATIPISRLLAFSKEKCNKNLLEFPIDIDLLIAINRWCNSYIHTGFFSSQNWLVERIISVLCTLFLEPAYGKTCFDLEGSIKIKEEYLDNGFYSDLQEFLSKKGNKIYIEKTAHRFVK